MEDLRIRLELPINPQIFLMVYTAIYATVTVTYIQIHSILCFIDYCNQ